jgi:hypothetical protein
MSDSAADARAEDGPAWEESMWDGRGERRWRDIARGSETVAEAVFEWMMVTTDQVETRDLPAVVYVLRVSQSVDA